METRSAPEAQGVCYTVEWGGRQDELILAGAVSVEEQSSGLKHLLRVGTVATADIFRTHCQNRPLDQKSGLCRFPTGLRH